MCARIIHYNNYACVSLCASDVMHICVYLFALKNICVPKVVSRCNKLALVGSHIGSMMAQVGHKLISCWLKLAQDDLMLVQIGSD